MGRELYVPTGTAGSGVARSEEVSWSVAGAYCLSVKATRADVQIVEDRRMDLCVCRRHYHHPSISHF